MQWRSPITGGGLNDAQLEHVVELLCDAKAVGAQTLGSGGDQWASSLNVMCDTVLHGGLMDAWLCNRREFC